jgi:hypothetical protein
MKLSTGAHTSGPARQHGQLTDALARAHLSAELSSPRLGALSTEVARRFKSYYGGEPPKATSVRFYDGYVVTVLEHRPARDELSPAESGPAPLVGEPSHHFDEAMAAELVRAAEQALGRQVLAHRTQVIPASRIRFEIFELAGPRDRGRGLLPVGVERS